MDINNKEISILKYSAMGYSNEEIAIEINISQSYVRKLLEKLYTQTSTRNKAHLVSWAYKNKILGGTND